MLVHDVRYDVMQTGKAGFGDIPIVPSPNPAAFNRHAAIVYVEGSYGFNHPLTLISIHPHRGIQTQQLSIYGLRCASPVQGLK